MFRKLFVLSSPRLAKILALAAALTVGHSSGSGGAAPVTEAQPVQRLTQVLKEGDFAILETGELIRITDPDGLLSYSGRPNLAKYYLDYSKLCAKTTDYHDLFTGKHYEYPYGIGKWQDLSNLKPISIDDALKECEAELAKRMERNSKPVARNRTTRIDERRENTSPSGILFHSVDKTQLERAIKSLRDVMGGGSLCSGPSAVGPRPAQSGPRPPLMDLPKTSRRSRPKLRW